jgi:hypothetical protein
MVMTKTRSFLFIALERCILEIFHGNALYSFANRGQRVKWRPMRVLEISVNGQMVCKAGTADDCAISAIVSYIKNGSQDDCWCDVSASVGESGDFARWLRQRQLSTGDEVTIRVIDSEVADDPHIERTR